MPDEIKVLPCPFCGREMSTMDVNSDNATVCFVRCTCSIAGPNAGTEELAVERWNHRASLVEGLPQADNTQSKTLSPNIKEKFTEFVESQRDIPPEFAQVINDNFWDLL